MDEIIVPDSQTQVTVPSIADLPEHEKDDEFESVDNLGSMSKRWLVTAWPEYLGEDWTPAELLQGRPDYMCWGLEKAPETGREHFHVYLRFSIRKRMRQVIDMFGTNRLKCFHCRGTEAQVRDYCHKTGKHAEKQSFRLSFGEEGAFKADEGKQGKRTDLANIAEQILAGTTMVNIALEHPADYIRYNKGLEAFACLTREPPPRERDVQVLWLWGPTGTGKTHRIMTSEIQLDGVFTVTRGAHQWDGYNGEKTILLDEWRSADWPIQMMNKILDKWKYELPCRYRNKFAEWTRVMICSNDTPSSAYVEEPNPEMRRAFFRRVATACRYVDKREDQDGLSLTQLMNMDPEPTF